MAILVPHSPTGFIDMKTLGFPVSTRRAHCSTNCRCRYFRLTPEPGSSRCPRARDRCRRRGNRSRTRGSVENMEGAAVAHVAHLQACRSENARNQQPGDESRYEALEVEGAAPAAQEAAARLDSCPAVNFAFSPCPNDTFAFHAIVHGLVPGVSVTPHLDDIEALNIRATVRTLKSPRCRSTPTGMACAIATCCCDRVARPVSVSVRSSSRRQSARSVGASRFPASGRRRRCCCDSWDASTRS